MRSRRRRRPEGWTHPGDAPATLGQTRPATLTLRLTPVNGRRAGVPSTIATDGGVLLPFAHCDSALMVGDDARTSYDTSIFGTVIVAMPSCDSLTWAVATSPTDELLDR
jgi:hypothetical protein